MYLLLRQLQLLHQHQYQPRLPALHQLLHLYLHLQPLRLRRLRPLFLVVPVVVLMAVLVALVLALEPPAVVLAPALVVLQAAAAM